MHIQALYGEKIFGHARRSNARMVSFEGRRAQGNWGSKQPTTHSEDHYE